MTSSELWTAADAERYDAEDAAMFSPEVLGPTVDFLADLAGDGRALELAIGTGRVGVALHRHGVPVTGIELSEPMAAKVHTKVDPADLPVVIGDMATTRVEGEFTLVYLVYNTITNLLTQAEQVECFRNAARHLAAGGRFVVECGIPPLRFLPPGQVAVPFDVSDDHLGFDTFDLTRQLLTSHHVTRTEDGWRRGESTHRFVWPAEMDLMATIAGLELEARFAGWDRTPLTDDSGSAVSVWRTPSGYVESDTLMRDGVH